MYRKRKNTEEEGEMRKISSLHKLDANLRKACEIMSEKEGVWSGKVFILTLARGKFEG